LEGGVDSADRGQRPVLEVSELVARNSEAQTGCPITYMYTRHEGSEMLERHGFHVIDVHVDPSITLSV
jgi:hypothetical protein